MTVGPSLAPSLEPLAHHQSVASSELAQLVPLSFSRGRSTHYSDRLHYFSVFIPTCKDGYDNSFFPRTARLCN